MKFTLAATIAAALLHAETGTLFEVVDGDTVEFNRGAVKCRLAYIDTPESRRNRKAKKDVSRCNGVTLDTMVKAGKEATKHASTLLKRGKSYRYEVLGHDRYGRSICVIALPGAATYNDTMISDGFALPYRQYIDKSERRRFDILAREAKRTGQGLWKTTPAVMQCLDRY